MNKFSAYEYINAGIDDLCNPGNDNMDESPDPVIATATATATPIYQSPDPVIATPIYQYYNSKSAENKLGFKSLLTNINTQQPTKPTKADNPQEKDTMETLLETMLKSIQDDKLKSGQNSNEETNAKYLKTLQSMRPKKKKMAIPKAVKQDVWNIYVGSHIIEHRCLCCKKAYIRNTSFHCGHVISEKHGGTLEMHNLRPICASCNSSMGTENMIEYVKRYGYYI